MVFAASCVNLLVEIRPGRLLRLGWVLCFKECEHSLRLRVWPGKGAPVYFSASFLPVPIGPTRGSEALGSAALHNKGRQEPHWDRDGAHLVEHFPNVSSDPWHLNKTQQAGTCL